MDKIIGQYKQIIGSFYKVIVYINWESLPKVMKYEPAYVLCSMLPLARIVIGADWPP